MIPIDRCNRLLDSGLSLITVGESKRPNFSWQEQQTKQLTKDEFKRRYVYSGGMIKKDGDELPATRNIGIVTGYNNLECIDVDTKVIANVKERQKFWDEYLSFLKDNIEEFDEKFVIYKTISGGFHIIYRCEEIARNTKIASLEGMKEAILESRGKGGYIFAYELCLSKNDYTNIQTISVQDREILWAISKTYDFKGEDTQVKVEVKEYEPTIQDDVSPWDEYNSRHSCTELIESDFSIVRSLNDKYVIKRHGAESPHSGYIYKSNGCMYLFTTGTQFPNEKLITPFAYYTYKFHNGDFKASASELYSKGYGSRKVRQIEIEDRPKIDREKIIFPIEIYPQNIQDYILESNRTLGLSIDYMGCSLLWLTSVIIGNTMRVEIKKGWIESCAVWISVVGKAGIGKTPSISQMIYPLERLNNREIRNYIKQYQRYVEYEKKTKDEKAYSEEIKQPKKTQFIVNDITLEALVEIHEENKNSIGVFKDELAGWFKDMNKYRAGSDLEFWLSCWSGKSVSLNRKTARSSFVDKPFIPVLGGIQPSIFDQFNTDENKDNGFTDRMLISYPDLFVDVYNTNVMNPEIIEWYEGYIVRFFDQVKLKFFKLNNDDDVEPLIVPFTPSAEEEWIRIFNKITAMQNSDSENEYMKSMLPKQKSYIPRFSLLLNSLWAYDSPSECIFEIISKDSVLRAEMLSDYFVNMAKKVKIDSKENSEIRKAIKANGDKSKFDVFKEMYQKNPELNRSQVAEMLDVSRQTVGKWIHKIDGNL
jgi:hypothetical protein